MGRWNCTMCNYTGMQQTTSSMKSGSTFAMFDGVPDNRYYPGLVSNDPTAYGAVTGPRMGQFKQLAYDYDVIMIAITR